MARVVVTRPRQQAARLVERLEERGHEVAVCPLLEIQPLGDGAVDVDRYDWVIVTSRNGAEQLLERRTGALPRVAAIGPGTADELRRRGVEPDLVATVSTQEGLLAELPRPAGRVLFAGAEGARRLLVDELGADFVPLYRAVPARADAFPSADAVVLASPSAAHAFAALRLALPAVSIGPQTSAAARAGGVRVIAEAKTHDIDGLVAAVDSIAR